jgi:hypothetical protein
LNTKLQLSAKPIPAVQLLHQGLNLKTSINHNEHNGHNETACAKPFFGIHPVGESGKPAMFLILVVFFVHVVVQLLFSGSTTPRRSDRP